MHGKTAAPIFGARLDKEDHHVSGCPVPEVQHKAKGYKLVHANGIGHALIGKATVPAASAVDGATELACTSCGVFCDHCISALELKGIYGWIHFYLVCAHVVYFTVAIHGKVALRSDELGFETQERREESAV